jgi:hypothetical protein
MRTLKYVFAVLFTLAFCFAIVTHVVLWYKFRVGCEDYLKLAGDAPTIERATEFLGKAVNYLEEKRLTSGNSAFLFPIPRKDVGIWYSQLKSAYEVEKNLVEQAKVNPDSVSQLTRDNALMKIREVVLDEGSHGTIVTAPANIVVYPYQRLFLLWYIISFLLAAIFWLAAVFSESY